MVWVGWKEEKVGVGGQGAGAATRNSQNGNLRSERCAGSIPAGYILHYRNNRRSAVMSV